MMKSRIFGNKFTLIVIIALIAVFISFPAIAAETQRDYVISLIRDAGMKDNMIGTTALDRDALARSLGFLDNWNYNATAVVTDEIKAEMDVAMAGAFDGLLEALNKNPMEPYFVNGRAQPIFYYGNNRYNDTSGEGAVRFVVYVESDLDTDNDGKLDLVKVVVQLPRAVLDGGKFSTIYEARPYVEGTNGQTVGTTFQTAGNNFLTANPSYSHESLYATAAPRMPSGEATTAQMVANANYRDWYYRYTGGSGSASIANGTGSNETEYEDLNWYDYFLVRGFAVVLSAGIGSAGSEGFSTCGADVEINAFRCVIEWLTGDRKAYTNKTSNIEIKADWSNGNVGMTGRSYAGTTQFGLATTGVKGLKTVVPVAGIASWYEYTNGQGVATSIPYTVGLAWHCNSRLASSTWSSISNRYSGYSQLMRREENNLVGDYGPHWARRDYTVDNWFRDWGPSKIQIPMLIVHGANDDNVRSKQSVMMNDAAKKAGVPIKWMWHQGHHMTPTFPRATPNATDAYRPYSMYCGDYTYDEWLNMWFSHHLYGLDNNIMKKFPGVLALDNASGQWVSYDAWESQRTIVLDNTNLVRPAQSLQAMAFERIYEAPENYSVEFPLLDHTPLPEPAVIGAPISFVAANEAIIMAAAAEDTTVINSANGSSSWQNFLNAPTAGSTVYSIVLDEDVAIKGVVKINLRAAISSLGSAANEPLRVHAKLAEVAATGTTLRFYGGNAMGSTIAVTTVQSGGSWQGGGIASHNIARFNQATTGTYREIAKGWLDLNNPMAGFDSHTANRENRIIARDNLGVYHDYTLFLQPAVHTAKKGNRLALIITTGGASSAAYSGTSAFTFTIDNEATNAIIPVAIPVITINAEVTPTTTLTQGNITGELTAAASVTMGGTPAYQWYSNTVNSNTGGALIAGETNASFKIPENLTAGTYYFYCLVSAAGAEPVASNVAAVIVNRPVITVTGPSPMSATVAQGSISSITVTASVNPAGTSELSYQWYRNSANSNSGGTLLTDATAASLTVPMNLDRGVHYLYCVVSGTNGALTVNSNVATLTVNDAPGLDGGYTFEYNGILYSSKDNLLHDIPNNTPATVKLLKNVEYLLTIAGKVITFELNGYDLTGGIQAKSGSVVTLSGSTSGGVEAYGDGSAVNVKGDARNGVSAHEGGTVNVEGDVYNGVTANDYGTVNIGADVTGDVEAGNNATVIIGLDVIGSVKAYNRGTVIIGGDVYGNTWTDDGKVFGNVMVSTGGTVKIDGALNVEDSKYFVLVDEQWLFKQEGFASASKPGYFEYSMYDHSANAAAAAAWVKKVDIAPAIVVKGIKVPVTVVNGVAILEPTQERMAAILSAAGNDIVFDLKGYDAVDLIVGATWFKDVDKTITIVTAKGTISEKTKMLWNNSGMTRVISVRNGKSSITNINNK